MRNVVKTTLVMDIECYVDYFLVMFRRVDTGATRQYEMFDGQRLDTEEIRRIMRTYRVVTFNGNNYDLPMLAYALTGVMRIIVPLGASPKRLDCARLYDLEIERLKAEIEQLKRRGGAAHPVR